MTTKLQELPSTISFSVISREGPLANTVGEMVMSGFLAVTLLMAVSVTSAAPLSTLRDQEPSLWRRFLVAGSSWGDPWGWFGGNTGVSSGNWFSDVYINTVLADRSPAEKEFMRAMANAASTNQLTAFIQTRGYDDVIRFLYGMDETRGRYIEMFIIQQMEKEAAMTVTMQTPSTEVSQSTVDS